VLRTGPPTPTLPETHVRVLATALGGLVAVGSEFPDASTMGVRLQSHATEAQCLAAAIRQLPATAGMLAWFDGVAPVIDWPAAIAELSSELGIYDAALFAAPVTDAVKQVQGDRICRGIARDGLCVPVPPLLLRATVARNGLLEHLDHGEDPISALSASGLTVRVVPMRAPIKL
jgi:2-C-methyl-D-erythritol 4-phosphate cytidylyltransferase